MLSHESLVGLGEHGLKLYSRERGEGAMVYGGCKAWASRAT